VSANQPPAPGGPTAGTPHPRGTLILVLGILAIIPCGFITGLPAIFLGKKAMDEAKATTYSNAGMIKAGFICGIVGTALSLLGLLSTML
jgi:hypothetical protein